MPPRWEGRSGPALESPRTLCRVARLSLKRAGYPSAMTVQLQTDGYEVVPRLLREDDLNNLRDTLERVARDVPEGVRVVREPGDAPEGLAGARKIEGLQHVDDVLNMFLAPSPAAD